MEFVLQKTDKHQQKLLNYEQGLSKSLNVQRGCVGHEAGSDALAVRAERKSGQRFIKNTLNSI